MPYAIHAESQTLSGYALCMQGRRNLALYAYIEAKNWLCTNTGSQKLALYEYW